MSCPLFFCASVSCDIRLHFYDNDSNNGGIENSGFGGCKTIHSYQHIAFKGLKMKEKLLRICLNCNHFFPATTSDITEFGICLNDEEFEPFIDELIENCNYSCCQTLVDEKKFDGNCETCSDYSEIDMDGCIEFDENSKFGRILCSAIESGNFSKEILEELILEKIKTIDFKTLPVDKYSDKLGSPKPEKRHAAIAGLGGLIAQGNKGAFKMLFEYLQQLPSPKTIEKVHFKIDILRRLEHSDSKLLLIPLLINELYNTPSNNTTRQWISAIFKFFQHCPYEEIRDPLTEMLSDKRFSYRLKKKMKDILYMRE